MNRIITTCLMALLTIGSAMATPPSPPPLTTWYWQLQGTVDTNRSATIYDIDLFSASEAMIAALKASGHTVICYFSAGTYENWRPDKAQFPAEALGRRNGWPGEKWLDTRNATVRTIMAARMDMAKSKGCSGLEPDNIDGYQNRTGFPLHEADAVSYDTFLATQAHARDLLVALKNSSDLAVKLVDKFDFAIAEECFRYKECAAYSPFVTKSKAVLSAEYSAYSPTICTKAKTLKFSTVFYSLDLDGSVYKPCP